MEMVKNQFTAQRSIRFIVILLYTLIFTACGTLDNSDLPDDATQEPLPDQIMLKEIDFADQNLKDCVLATKLTYAFQVTTLTCEGKSISQLDGIEHLYKLNALHLTENAFNDLTPLSSLIELNTLRLQNYNGWDTSNDITGDVEPLKSLVNLTMLNVGKSGIISIEPLQHLVNLNYLLIQDNKIVDISWLSEIESLISITAGNNKIEDLSAVQYLDNLVFIYFYDNQINSITSLSGLSNLTHIVLYGNQIDKVCSLEHLTKIQVLHLQSNLINDDVTCLNPLKDSIIDDDGYRLNLSNNINMPCDKWKNVRAHFGTKIVSYDLPGCSYP